MSTLEKTQNLKGRRFLFVVESSANPSDYRKYEELRKEVWRDLDDTLAGGRNLANENYFDKGGALFIALYAEDEKKGLNKTREAFVGFSYGFVGVKDKKVGFNDPDNLIFYSQYLAVRREFQNYGLGVALKEFQRDILLSYFKVNVMTCTFDPLTGVNANRNIHRFKMDILAYKESYYEDFRGLLNRKDVPSDRFFVSWDLTKKAQRKEYDLEQFLVEGHIALGSEMAEVKGKSGSITLEKTRDVDLTLEHEFVLIEIPYDYYFMLQETDVEDRSVRDIAVQWRLASRRAFQLYLKRGFRVVDFQSKKTEERNRNFYILQRM